MIPLGDEIDRALAARGAPAGPPCPPPANHAPAAALLPASCDICGTAIGEAAPVKKPKTVDGERITVVIHAECWEEYERTRAERVRQQDADRAAANRRRRANAKRAKLAADVEHVLAQFPAWEGARVDNPDFLASLDARLVRLARNWRPESGHVWICGLTGSSKTMSLAALARRWGAQILESGTPDPMFSDAAWMKALWLAEATKWHRLGTGEPPALARARAASVLFLDDLGQEAAGMEHVLFGLIDERYEFGRPTIVTCGLTLQEVSVRYGQHLSRRFSEKSVGSIIDLFPRTKLEVVK
jgi:DNA replication protein DnaC